VRSADLSSFLSPNSSLANYGTGSGASWAPVDPEKALETTIALYSCVALLAETIGSLPLHLYRRVPNGREKVEYGSGIQSMPGRGYPGSSAKLIGLLPNDEMTAQDLWTNCVGHCALWGNAYIQVIRDAAGRPSVLWLMRPDRMKVDRDNQGSLRYQYRPSATSTDMQVIPEVMHIRAFGTDGVMGISPIQVARLRVAADKGMAQFGSNWYANGARPSAVLTMPPAPNDKDKYQERVKLYRDDISSHYSGTSNSGKVVVIQNGADWKTLSMPMEDMQFIETLHFAVEDWARLYRIPGFMVGQTQRGEASYNSVEQRNLHFLTYSLRPILSRIEGSITRSLGLVPGVKTLEDEGLYPEFLTAELLRTDLKTRYETYQIAIQSRILSPAGAAEIENLGYDPKRPAEFENPNTKPEAPAPPPDPAAQQQQDQQNARSERNGGRGSRYRCPRARAVNTPT
jgi:HK97 family phage portal protein